MQTTNQNPKPEKSYPFFVEALLNNTNLVVLDLINIIAGYLIPATKIEQKLYRAYLDNCTKFDVTIQDKQFYILPAIPRDYCAQVANQDEKLTAIYAAAYHKVQNSDWLRYINTFTYNAYIFLNRMRLIELEYGGNKKFFSTQRFKLILDSTIDTASEYHTIPGFMYMQLLLNPKITGYFRERNMAKTEWSAEEHSDLERYLAWIGDEEIINRGKELQNKKMETNPNYNLLTNNIRINVFLTAVAIKIFKIDLIICEKNGAKKREYDKYGWEIIKPLIHSLKHNLFKSSYEIDYILYIPVLQEQINKYYTDVWRKKAQREFSEFYKEMTEVESLLELGMELFPVSSDSTKSKLEGEPDNASQSDIRYSVGYSAASSASSSSVNIGIFHSVNRLSPASPQNPAIPRQPSDENGKNLGAGLPL